MRDWLRRGHWRPHRFSNGTRELLRFDRRLELVVLRQLARELVVRASCRRVVAELEQEGDQPAYLRFVRQEQCCCSARKTTRHENVARPSLLAGERPSELGRALPQPLALRVQPALEFRRARNVESVEEVAAVQTERRLELYGIDRSLERGHVARHQWFADADFVLAASDDRAVT